MPSGHGTDDALVDVAADAAQVCSVLQVDQMGQGRQLDLRHRAHAVLAHGNPRIIVQFMQQTRRVADADLGGRQDPTDQISP